MEIIFMILNGVKQRENTAIEEEEDLIGNVDVDVADVNVADVNVVDVNVAEVDVTEIVVAVESIVSVNDFEVKTTSNNNDYSPTKYRKRRKRRLTSCF
ncbi:hypothetical protein ABK040_014807 [Willaertia magna]